MKTLQLFKATLYAYIITVMRKVDKEIEQHELEIDELGVGATESELLRIERLARGVDRGNQQLRALRSILGDD